MGEEKCLQNLSVENWTCPFRRRRIRQDSSNNMNPGDIYCEDHMLKDLWFGINSPVPLCLSNKSGSFIPLIKWHICKQNIWTHNRRKTPENKNRHVTRGRYCKIYRILLRSYGHSERMQNQRIPKQSATATVEGMRKNGRPCKKTERWDWRGFKHNGNKNRQAMARCLGMKEDCTGSQNPQ